MQKNRTIYGSEIVLLPPSIESSGAVYDLIVKNRVHLSLFMPWVELVKTQDLFLKNTKDAVLNFEHFEGEQRYLIVRRNDQVLLGVLGLMVRDRQVPFFEIGYWLDESESGKGYASVAVTIMTKYLSQQYHAKRIEIRTAESNLASRRVAERCKFVLEAVLSNERILPSGAVDNTAVYYFPLLN
ncbi:Hypothetical ribosomal protein N-acetyltransferase [Moritella sp. PE36]|uniref:GNAT family N-acetyltransferase n=1 Tax=Moritella sp. PE36 TaxID=58051 RepID=UPI00015699D3|nr:GNAT family N-acetyltransferase [Moritella sp. PE36]EDM66671.1 Hypothetical ribosomal protein N-acetyltransferase [Moritella sp. PE36]